MRLTLEDMYQYFKQTSRLLLQETEVLVSTYQITRCCISVYRNLNSRRQDKPKFEIIFHP